MLNDYGECTRVNAVILDCYFIVGFSLHTLMICGVKKQKECIAHFAYLLIAPVSVLVLIKFLSVSVVYLVHLNKWDCEFFTTLTLNKDFAI